MVLICKFLARLWKSCMEAFSFGIGKWLHSVAYSLFFCSSDWINSQLALYYNRLHSLLISKLTIFSTANQLRQLYHNENSRIFFEKLWPTLKSLRITGRPELVLAHMVANDRLGILKLMVWTEAMFWNCVTSKIVSLKIAS